MITATVMEEFDRAKLRFIQATQRGAGISIEKERMKNLMYNYYDDILETLKEGEKTTAEIENLKQENALLRNAVVDLTAKLNAKKKMSAKEDPETKG